MDRVLFDLGFTDGVDGREGTILIASVVVMKISPSRVRTAYWR